MVQEYLIEFIVNREDHFGERDFQDLVNRYHGAILSAPELDAGSLGKGFRGRISPDKPVTLEELSDRYCAIIFDGFKKTIERE